MDFFIDEEVLRKTFVSGDDDNRSLRHDTMQFGLFPFTTSGNTVEDLDCTVGEFLRILLSQTYTELDAVSIKEAIREELKVQNLHISFFDEVVNTVFFRKGGNGEKDTLRPLNLQMFSYISRRNIAEQHIANYLSSVLGPIDQVERVLREAIDKANRRESVLERILLQALPSLAIQSFRPNRRNRYYPVFANAQKVFLQDLKFVLETTNRTISHLVELLEFYYFFYTSQTCLLLRQKLNGRRDEIVPLYFSLDWEKTNQGRKCYTDGWRLLEPAVKDVFFHAVLLGMINQRESEDRYDYVAIQDMIDSDPEMDRAIAEQIRKCTEQYCKVGEQQTPGTGLSTAEEIDFLYATMQKIVDEHDLYSAVQRYSSRFSKFCEKHFLKARGKSGRMLSLTEQKLIFITKLCIGSNEKMRLTEVFKRFEDRGVYLDDSSKALVMQYYERLNLIEKKSDSGDAQYVKRIS